VILDFLMETSLNYINFEASTKQIKQVYGH
jgi:hypothetical protein